MVYFLFVYLKYLRFESKIDFDKQKLNQFRTTVSSSLKLFLFQKL